MATLTVQIITRSGLEPTALVAAAAGGDDFVNSGREYIEINNGGGSDITVTVNSQQLCNQGFNHSANEAVVVTAAEKRKIGPFATSRFNDPADGKVKWTYSGVTSVTVGVFKLP